MQACPPVDPIRTKHGLSTAEPAAFLRWNNTMMHMLAQLKSDRMQQVTEARAPPPTSPPAA